MVMILCTTMFLKQVMYLLGCMSLHCFNLVNVQKILLPGLDLLMTVQVLLYHGTINVLDVLFFDAEWRVY